MKFTIFAANKLMCELKAPRAADQHASRPFTMSFHGSETETHVSSDKINTH